MLGRVGYGALGGGGGASGGGAGANTGAVGGGRPGGRYVLPVERGRDAPPAAGPDMLALALALAFTFVVLAAAGVIDTRLPTIGTFGPGGVAAMDAYVDCSWRTLGMLLGRSDGPDPPPAAGPPVPLVPVALGGIGCGRPIRFLTGPKPGKRDSA